MTGAGSNRLAWLRIALAGIVIVDLFSFFFFLGDARPIGMANGTLYGFNDLVSTAAVRGVVVLLGMAGAVAFARRPGRLWAGLLSLGALALLSTVHARLFGSPWRHLYYSGVCLSGWLLGLAVARRRGAPTDESYARMGSIALLSAAYLNAGISKLAYGGFDWLSGLPIQEVIVGQDGLVPDGILSVYRVWVATHPAVASLCSVMTMSLELAAPLMLVGRATRAAVALGLFAMHANIYLLTDILYWEAIAFLLLFGLSPDVPSAETVPGAAAVIMSDNRAFAATAAVLALGALVAIGHQGLRFAAAQVARARSTPPAVSTPLVASVPPEPPRASEPTRPPALRRIGPFAVGDAIAGEWTVDAVEIHDDAILTVLSGPLGRAIFEMTCAASEHQGLFDVGAAHIFYSSDLMPGELEAAGWALRAKVQGAAQGDDICASLTSWRTSAQTGAPR